MKDYMEESEESSDNVMGYSKGLLQLPWAFSCRPSTVVPGLLAYNSVERLEGPNDVSQFGLNKIRWQERTFEQPRGLNFHYLAEVRFGRHHELIIQHGLHWWLMLE